MSCDRVLVGHPPAQSVARFNGRRLSQKVDLSIFFGTIVEMEDNTIPECDTNTLSTNEDKTRLHR